MAPSSSGIADPSQSFFRLLMPHGGPTPTDVPSIELGGIHWVRTEYAPVPAPDKAPAYTCISYSWGQQRSAANPFEDGRFMSDRAIPAVEAAIRSLRPAAIWLDAFCVPAQDPARAACLRSMGKIYGSAAQVVAVLSKPCSVVLEQIHSTGQVDPAMLLVLETDDWVNRAWTYQEMVNGSNVYFITEESNGAAVGGEQFLNAVGKAIADYKKAQGFDSFKLRTLHPRLDSLEDSIADWLTAAYLERTAYQVMSAMDRRTSEQEDDHFNAMIGAITTTPLDNPNALPLHPAEHFMRVCEAKDDYSFIYCVAPRSKVSGRGWRPLAGPIPAVLPWHSYGDGQSGSLSPTHLQLNNMCRVTPGAVNSSAQQLIIEWLESDNAGSARGDIASSALERLRQAGFTGCGEHLELESGLFFPQSPVPQDGRVIVVIASGIRWVHGAPGLLLKENDTEIHSFCGVGIFVGPLADAGDPINIK